MANKKNDNRRQQGSMNDHIGRQQSQETGRDHDRKQRSDTRKSSQSHRSQQR